MNRRVISLLLVAAGMLSIWYAGSGMPKYSKHYLSLGAETGIMTTIGYAAYHLQNLLALLFPAILISLIIYTRKTGNGYRQKTTLITGIALSTFGLVLNIGIVTEYRLAIQALGRALGAYQ